MWGQPPSAVRRAKLDVVLSSHPYSLQFPARRRPPGNFFGLPFVTKTVVLVRGFMRAYLANLTPKTRMLLAVPALVIAYSLVTCVLPAVARAVVPDAVRSVLSLL
jgi:hypothetical protein